MAVVIVDYGAGNLKSAAKALVAAAQGTGAEIRVTADAEAVLNADRIWRPGGAPSPTASTASRRIPDWSRL